ncbi:MAG TPA: thioesterase family protein [Vicinamibacterales bacterium]|nr:thioesterase family protein [Vicinamibacterales bacterium]
MSEHVFSHRLDVRFRDCDALGHVNNAVYFTYMEQARFKHWRTLWGFGEDRFPDPGIILARAECDFRSPARVGEQLEVRLLLAGIGRTSFTYEYEIASAEDGRTIANARSVQVVYNYASSTPVPVPDLWRQLLARKLV